MKFKMMITAGVAWLAMMAASATTGSLRYGYCNGEVNKTMTFNSAASNVWMHAAIYVPASSVNVFGGNAIDSIRAGLTSKLNIDSLRVWVRSELDGPNLAQGLITTTDGQTIQKEWNQIALSEPYTIDGTNTTGLYIGYSYHQKGSCFGMSVIPTPTPGGLFVKMADADWADHSDFGVLSVEAVITGENLPMYNLTLNVLQVQPVYITDKGTLDVSIRVRNVATQTVNGFTVVTTIGQEEPVLTHISEPLAYAEEKEIGFTIEPGTLQPGEYPVSVTISGLDEGDDENPEDNTLATTIAVVAHDYERHILVEEFTGEACVNCPRVAEYMHNLLAMPEYGDRVVAVCHHAGFNADWLTIPSDEDYCWFYNNGGQTYAPGIMVDRTTVSGNTPVFNPDRESTLKQRFDYQLQKPAYVSLKVEATVTGGKNGEVAVSVTGERAMEQFTAHPARITVALLEDNIKAHRQSGAQGDFIHQHVSRAVNSTWGEVIEWQGDEYAYECHLPLNSAWQLRNMKVVAYIWDYDPEDPSQCAVANASALSLAPLIPTGIAFGMPSDEDSPSDPIYSLQGQRVATDVQQSAQLPHGVYVSRGRKILK